MTQEELKTLQELNGSPHYELLKKAILEKLEELKDITLLNEEFDIAIQALGRKYAYQNLSSFLDLIGIPPTTRKIDKTYE